MTSSNPLTLNALKGGIDRRRIKGGPSPEVLYDLVNGYVDGQGRCVGRPGTVEEVTLPAGTHGLLAFGGELVVFAVANVESIPAGYALEIIPHPTNADADIAYIHFNDAFMGAIYITVEYDDGSFVDFWLRRSSAWAASTFYLEGQLVEPSVPNGYVYRARRQGEAAPVWAPDVVRAVGDIVEPTTPNGYRYTVDDVLGANPRSGATEPTWPTEEGAQVIEDTDLASATDPTPGGEDDLDAQLPGDVEDRYSNIGGGLQDFVNRIINR